MLLTKRLLPELKRFPTPEEAKAALRTARQECWFDARHSPLFNIVKHTLKAVAIILVAEALFMPLLIFYPELWFPSLMVFLLFANDLGILLFRKGLQTALRWQLTRQSQAICIPCGYDLTGNASGRCPECGELCDPNRAALDALLRAAYPPAGNPDNAQLDLHES